MNEYIGNAPSFEEAITMVLDYINKYYTIKSSEIKEIGTTVYLLKDNKLFFGEITDVKITPFSDNFANIKVNIQYKICDKWYFASNVFNDINAVTEYLKSNCQMLK